MRVDIWSDIRCPFCYIGKRKFEKALEQFPHKDNVEVQWRSFELDSSLKTRTDIDIYDYLAQAKGISREQAQQMHHQVEQIAEEVGLNFKKNDVAIANSFNAHRLIQLAKTKGLADAAEEQLFKAYFTENKNIDDVETLIQTGLAIGLDAQEVKEMLASDTYQAQVQQDEFEAQSIGVRGVPFFVFNNKYAISGAQSPEVFLQALTQAWTEFEKEKQPIIITEGNSCSADGICN